jgi:hypothetical protein
MSYKLPLALIALAIVMLVGCKQPIGVPSEVHAATTQTIYCRPQGIREPTGRIEWYQQTLGLTDGDYDWHDDTIRVGYIENSGRAYPRSNGICVFEIPPFESPDEIPTCTLYYYQLSHTEPGEDESFLVNWWDVGIHWPLVLYSDRYGTFWTIWNSTDTVATDVIHEDDGWQKVPLHLEACALIADSGATGDTTRFFTGWVYHGSVDGADTYVAGYENESNLQPFIKVVYDDGN